MKHIELYTNSSSETGFFLLLKYEAHTEHYDEFIIWNTELHHKKKHKGNNHTPSGVNALSTTWYKG